MKNTESEDNRAWILLQIGQAEASGFHGDLKIIFERGKIRRVVKTQSLLPPKHSA